MTDAYRLSKAVVVLLGYGVTAFPDENPVRLVDAFGGEEASKIEPHVLRLLEEMNELKPEWTEHTLLTAGAWAKEKMRRGHPELTEEALSALEWAFTWWWR